MLLVVAESSGSSPGRRGYKMAVASDGELIGSIGGGVMEVNLVEQSREILRDAETGRHGDAAIVSEQVHRKDAENASGMICSGSQTVVFFRLGAIHAPDIQRLLENLFAGRQATISIAENDFQVTAADPATAASTTDSYADDSILYSERIGFTNELFIIGGGHCALALSELMSKMDFHITLLDDRPELNTIDKNRYAHVIKIVDSYERIGDHVFSGRGAYLVVMTLGYKTDATVIRKLINGDYKYFGVLGSKAKMAAMFKEFRSEGIPSDRLDRIRTPIGLPIHSRTPEEIAVSIAAEIISVKNG
jgi:xanthine dehydrogenase accessory factor